MNIDLLKTKSGGGLIAIALASVVSLAAPGDAWGSPRRVRLMPHSGGRERVWVAPNHRRLHRTVGIAPVYERRAREVWREPVYELRRVLVEVPARIVRRRVPRLDLFGLRIGHEIVEEVIEPARQVWRTERVLVRPGRYETIYERVLVRPATTTIVHGDVLAPPGRWAGPRHPVVRKARSHRHGIRRHVVHRPRGPRRGVTVRFGG